ncbi:response regulator [Tenuifilum thalassicum]|jgi:CheY-like chemotaxis protein|uniref:Response regulator n=1 Tax=Tenuifilum thalassicum TaxID=2590900 RepID=A0A7D3XLP7_9BACT|nr:response regulator [Tenuifilum thalassicum]QKG79596.1 response regulator [Tenuifilum thalassicum]
MSDFDSFNWQGKKILIVDDDRPSIILLTVLLQRCGAKLFYANNGQQAIDVVNQNPDIDLILMDILMEGMSGIEASRIIRKSHPEMPIIAQTACVMTGDKERCIAAGCIEYVSKPIDAIKLLKIIDKYLNVVKLEHSAKE